MGLKNMANIMGESTDPCFIGCWNNDNLLLILMEKVC